MWAPLLAPNEDPLGYPAFFEDLESWFPVYVSPKLDGFRCVTKEGRCKSRKYIDLGSNQVQSLFGKYSDLDGEIVCGDETAPDVFNVTSSHVRAFNKPHPDVKFRIFDFASEELVDEPFEMRLDLVRDYVDSIGDPRITVIEQTLCSTIEEVLVCEEKYLAMGYEGVMIRTPGGRYKGGLKKANRATWLEKIICKLKRFEDIEAQVIGYEEGEVNTNEDVRDNFGKAKRSSAKSGMVAADTVGKFLVMWNGQIEKIPPGSFKKSELEFIWTNKERFLNKWLAIRHFPHGAIRSLRMARAKGFRDEMDM